MGDGSQYLALARLRQLQSAAASHQRLLPLAAAPTVKLDRPAVAPVPRVRVDYQPQASTRGTTTPVVLPRPVVSLHETRSTAASPHGAGLSRKLDQSLNQYLSQADLSTTAASVSKLPVASAS